MLDIIYLALTLAVFAVIALFAHGIDRLGPRGTPSARRTPADGEERP